MTPFSLGSVTGELKGGRDSDNISQKRNCIFLGSVMGLKCGSAAFGIADHSNSVNAEDEVLGSRILLGSAEIPANAPLP